jgi:archaellum component FlaC
MSMDDAPYRLAYYERLLNRIASEVGGNAKFHAERTASLVEEIDGLRKDLTTLVERVDRMTGELRQSVMEILKGQEADRAKIWELQARVDRMAEFLTKQKNGMKP